MTSALAEAPDLQPAINAVESYARRHADTLSPEHAQILLEICRRLERMRAQAVELIDINNRIWAKAAFTIRFDPETETIIISVGGEEHALKLNRADPGVPIQMRSFAAGIAYHAGSSKAMDEEEARLRVELEEKLESYYQSAHRVLKLFGRIPALSKIRCTSISRVRNELIEHPDDGALYSFGVGSNGPTVKPMHRGTPRFIDEGLVPNTEAFVKAIVAGCGAPASQRAGKLGGLRPEDISNRSV